MASASSPGVQLGTMLAHLTHAEIDVRALPNASSTILGPSYPPTATSECLRLRRAPPDSCTDEWTTDGCLQSPLPFRIPHATVEACFRCCVLNATAPLRANAAFWRRVWLAESRDPWGKGAAGKELGALGRLLGFDEDASVLLTALSGARHADAGATYANATLVTAPLWRSRGRPSGCIGRVEGADGARRRRGVHGARTVVAPWAAAVAEGALGRRGRRCGGRRRRA